MSLFPKSLDEFDDLYNQLNEQNNYFYLQQIEKIDDPYVYVNGRKMIMLASYSYLGLLHHPKIDAAAKAAIDKFGTGTHGVRILAGTETIHAELEETIAKFKHREAAIVYSSGYVTNLTTISTLFHKGDVVICDKFNHASIVDGCLLSGAEFLRFNHNNLEDLERNLIKTESYRNKCVIIDSVYSMDGDIAPVPEIMALAKKHNALLMVDEAHSLGVLGENGTGIEEYFKIPGQIDILMGTLSKVIPAIGGYITGNFKLINMLKHRARAFVFSAALTPPTAAAAITAFKIIQEEPWRIKKLNENVNYFITTLKNAGFNTLNSQTAIIPLIIPDEQKTWKVTKFLQDNNVFVLPVVTPAVPPNTSRLRMNVTASMDREHLDQVIDKILEADKIFHILD
jgi:8-amino-7-oxononanoate synthase